MIEGDVDHGVRVGRTAAQAFRVLQRSPVHLGTGGNEGLGAVVGTGHPDHLVTGLQEFGHQRGTDKAGGTCQKDSHR